MSTLILTWQALGAPGFLFVGLMFLGLVLRNPVLCCLLMLYAHQIPA
jgi:hypothetical protein